MLNLRGGATGTSLCNLQGGVGRLDFKKTIEGLCGKNLVMRVDWTEEHDVGGSGGFDRWD